MAVALQTLTGNRLTDAIEAVARLRIAVFREWPYLYEGSLAYEEDYLADFAKAGDAVIVTARDDGAIVGAATASPLLQHSAEFAPLFEARGIDPGLVFYFGESVLLPEWRGRGVGHGFFDRREDAARAARSATGSKYSHAAFCGVMRAADDPRRPPAYTPLDAFWRRRGFDRVPGMLGSYRWREIGAEGETDHPMQFWLKALRS